MCGCSESHFVPYSAHVAQQLIHVEQLPNPALGDRLHAKKTILVHCSQTVISGESYELLKLV